MKYLLSLVLLYSQAVSQENIILNGSVRDSNTDAPLPSAIIRILGTSLGTATNADGKYRLTLWPGKRTIVVSSLAYMPDTLHLILTNDESRDFKLTPSEIILPEVLVRGEDPAIEIIRRAIANKKRWMERLKSFAMGAFTRQVLKREGEIASITESFTKGYWQKGDTLREIVKQKRQTENIKSAFNFASVGRIINFNDDEIRFIGYTFVGPTAMDALDYYDYKLLRTSAAYGKEIHEIQVIPRMRTTPLFEGTISIAGDSYALMGVDVQPNEAVTIPFTKIKQLRYRQQFGLYDHSFWMPADIRIDVGVEVGILVIRIPRIDFTQTSVITDYEINAVIPDTIFQKPRLTVDTITTAALDTAFWQKNIILPLTVEEEMAYTTLDSTRTLEVQFRPRGISFQLGAGEGGGASLLEHFDVSFNRVEGLHLGAHAEFDSLDAILQLRGGLAYGFSDKRGKYKLGATIYTSSKRIVGFGADVYRVLDFRPDAGYYGPLFNSLTSIINKNDYRDYFEANGARIFLSFVPSTKLRTELSFIAETHLGVTQNSDFSIFARSSSFRPNPSADIGSLRSLALDLRLGDPQSPLDIMRRNALELSAEYSSPSLANSGFDFARVSGRGTITVRTFGGDFLLPPALTISAAAGTSDGSLPRQRLFDLESASSNYAPLGVFKAMNVKEFSGTRFVAFNVEHTFRSLPFLALGIPFLYENNIEFVIHGGAARTWSNTSYTSISPGVLIQLPRPIVNTTPGWYGEIGFGFSRIIELLRADFTWRLSAPKNFRFTLGVANIF